MAWNKENVDEDVRNIAPNFNADNNANNDLLQLLYSRGRGRSLCYSFHLKTLENGPYIPKSPASTPKNFLAKRQNQWTPEERGQKALVNQDIRLKTILLSSLPNDIMKSVIWCKTAKFMWTGLILGHEGPYGTRDSKIATLWPKFNAFMALEGEKSK